MEVIKDRANGGCGGGSVGGGGGGWLKSALAVRITPSGHRFKSPLECVGLPSARLHTPEERALTAWMPTERCAARFPQFRYHRP